MASWFTRALDRITPWDRGGEVQRRQERKKREEEEQRQTYSPPTQAPRQNSASLRVTRTQPAQTVSVEGTDFEPETKKPKNIFEDLNKNLVFNKPENAVDVINREANKPVERPKPGTVIKPKLEVTTARPNARIKLPDGRVSDGSFRTPKQIIDKGLDEGKSWEQIARENRFPVDQVKEYSEATRPNYGIQVERPNQSLGNRFRDIFDANTPSDMYRRQEGNKQPGAQEKSIILKNPGNIVSQTPIVGHVTKMLNTAAAQIAQLPATAEGMFLTRRQTDITNRLLEAQKNGDTATYYALVEEADALSQEVNKVFQRQEIDRQTFERNNGGLFNAGTLYGADEAREGTAETAIKDIALPTAVTALDIYTLGKGNLIAKGIQNEGLKTGIRTQAPNIVKAATGNFGSGSANAAANGATADEVAAAGFISSILGTGPDVLFPALGRTFRNRFLPKTTAATRAATEEIDDVAIAQSVENLLEDTLPKPIRVGQNIPVQDVSGLPQPVRVRDLTEPKPLIKEFPGDESLATPNALARRNAEEAREIAAAKVNNQARPDQRIEGVRPRKPEAPFELDEKVAAGSQAQLIDDYAKQLRELGEGNGVAMVPDGEGGYRRVSNNVRTKDTKGKRMTKADWRDEAERQLRAGEADPGFQKAFDDATDPEVQSLISKGEQPTAPKGTPIKVKEAKTIPVRDETVVPTGLPETPGTVREITNTQPTNAKSAEIAVNTPAPLPKEVQNVLDNPKKFSKREVASARNQRKLARQMAKVQEETSEALDRIDATKAGRQSGEGFAPTGELRKGKNKNIYEKSSQEAEAARARAAVADQSADDLIAEMSGKTEFSQYDVSRMNEIRERLMKEPGYRKRDDFRILDEIYREAGTQRGKGLALYNRVLRRNASGDRLTNQWYTKMSRVSDDAPNISDADFEAVARANNEFTKLRDAEVRLEEKYLQTGSEADFNAWQDAYKKSAQADIDAKTTELKVSKNALKGSKDENVAKVLSDMERDADLNMMDYVTSSQLSGPATGFRNLVGTELAGVENRLFANTRAKLTNLLFGENVGGYSRKAAREGRKEGLGKFGDDTRRRAVYSGKNPLKHIQNWATSVNSLGDSSLYSQAKSRLGKYYENQLKKQGFSGKDLDLRMKHHVLKDPDGMADTFLDASMKSSGLSGLYQKTQKIEKSLATQLAGQLNKAMSPKKADALARGIVRIGLGYPTATGNFIVQSGKRAAVGVPSFLETGVHLARGNKAAAALAFERGLKEAGSGAAGFGTGMALAQADLITGFYPEDKDERQRWIDEGKSELSVKIGDGWYPIPTQFGMLGLPLIFGAEFQKGGAEGVFDQFTTRKDLMKLLPADQAYGVLEVLGGDATENQDKSFTASTLRSFIPAGSALAQTAKGLDENANDMTTKDFWSNVRDQIITGIPGLNNANPTNIPDKVSSTGEPIKNPNLLQTFTGARSVEQPSGIANSQEVDAEINQILAGIDQFGLLSDPNIDGVLEGTGKEAFDKAKAGQQLDSSDIEALQKGLVKGVELSGSDTAYLERGQYDTNLAVLKLKKQLAENDPTVNPSSIEKLDVAIKRGEVYKDNEIPYDMISDYQDIGVEEWRKMGDPEEDEYDPEMYQRLWEIDKLMTEAGVSYRRGKLDQSKYYLKEKKSGSGRGRSGSASRKIGTDFGKLRAPDSAPQVRQYETIETQSGNIPRIRVVRPNIVHKISASR